MNELEEKLQYHFKNPEYLRTALTHSSYANEYHTPHGRGIPSSGWLWLIIFLRNIRICRKAT